MIEQDRCFVFRQDGVTAVFAEQPGERSCLLRTLTNTRSTHASVVIRLEGDQVARFTLLPFQKLGVYPAMVVAGGGARACLELSS
jgi:hypothetical protein